MTERPILFSIDTVWVKVAASRIGFPASEYVAALNRGEKICGGCRRTLTRNGEEFGTDKRTFDGLRSQCRQCVAESKKDHYHRTRPQQRARQLKYQRANREKLYAYNAAWQRRWFAALRADAITAYGGRCVCCGEAEPIFLDLDHINNDGRSHRDLIGNTQQVYKSLKADGWPAGIVQILCCNCNQGKARNGGTCPHASIRS